MKNENTVVKELRNMLYRGAVGTQFEIQEELKQAGINVTQSTISRCLKQLRAVRVRERSGKLVYRLNQEPQTAKLSGSVGEMIQRIESNDFLIVLHTQPGAAARVAYYLDILRPGGIIGTIAGDDTVFVATASGISIAKTVKAIEKIFVNGLETSG